MENVGSVIKQEELHITDFGHTYYEATKLAGNSTVSKIERDDGHESPVHLTTSHVFQKAVKLEHVGSNDCNLQWSEFLNIEREWRDEERLYQYQDPTKDPLALPLEDPLSVFFYTQHDTKPPITLLSVKGEREEVPAHGQMRVKQEYDSDTDDNHTDNLATKTSTGCRKKIRKRSSYTADFKRSVIVFAEQRNNRAAGRKFGVDEKCVRSWRAQREALIACPGAKRGFRGPRQGHHPQMEEEVADFVLRLRNAGRPVTFDAMQTKARAIAKRLGISPETFVASRTWADRLMRRQGFSLRPRRKYQPKLPVDFPDKVESFREEIDSLRRAKKYLPSQIGNADHMPILLDIPASYTIVRHNGFNEVHLKRSRGLKQRLNVMLSCTADGGKLPPYIVFKRGVIPKDLVFPSGVEVRANGKGGMNNRLMADWLESVWLRRPGASTEGDSLIVLDEFRGHVTYGLRNTLKENRTDLVTIAGRSTSRLLPLESLLEEHLKAGVRKRYSEWLGLTDFGRTERPKRIPITLLAQWVLATWSAIPPETLAGLFKTCCILNDLDSEGAPSGVASNRGAGLSKDEFHSKSEPECIYEYEEEEPMSTHSSEDSDSDGSYYDHLSLDSDD